MNMKTTNNLPAAHSSTGPKTDEGKKKSSMNALRHGLASAAVVLPNEDPAEFQAILDEWNDLFQATDPVTAALVEQAVTAKWRLERCQRVESQRLAELVRHAADRYD